MIAVDAMPGVTPAVRVAAIDAVGITRLIDERPILSDLTFTVPVGGFVALLGSNGAGKSTLLSLLAGLTVATSGTLTLFGEQVRRGNTRVRARIGVVGHGLMLYRGLTALENLVFFGRLHGVADPTTRAEKLLKSMQLWRRAHDPVGTLSRGMAQRVSIARALVHDPDLLLADEPFTGLDNDARAIVERTLLELHAEGRTIVMANHDLPQSLQIAEHVLVLRRGRVVTACRASQVDVAGIGREVQGV